MMAIWSLLVTKETHICLHCNIDSCSPTLVCCCDRLSAAETSSCLWDGLQLGLLYCLWRFNRYLFDSVDNVGWCNRVMNITSYMLPDNYILIDISFLSSGMVDLYVSMLNQTPKNVEYYIT